MSFENGFSARLNEFLADEAEHAKDYDQEDLTSFLEITRSCSWDIPSALWTICQHQLKTSNAELFDLAYVMHRTDSGFDELLVPHFKEVHNLDLADEAINWSFDT